MWVLMMRRVAKQIPIVKNGRASIDWVPVSHKSIVPPKKKTTAMSYLSPEEINGRHVDDTIFILGNGPSLKDTLGYKKKLRKSICISIYVAYWVIACEYILFADLNRLGSAMYEELLRLDSHVFTSNNSRISKWFNKYQQNMAYNGSLSARYEDGLVNGGGSLFIAINLAYVMGAKKIIMIGCDMNNGKHFYDDMPEFHKTTFYNFVKEDNVKRNPPKRKGYKGAEIVVPVLKKTKKFLAKNDVQLINTSKNSVLCGKYVPLGKLFK